MAAGPRLKKFLDGVAGIRFYGKDGAETEELEAGGMAKLEGGISWLGSNEKQDILVRQDYVDVYSLIQESKAVAYIGNPGTGKSNGGYVIMGRLVRRGDKVVYRSKLFRAGETCIVFSGKTWSLEPYEIAAAVLEDESAWFISDGLDISDQCSCRVLVITSPDENVVKQFRKIPGGMLQFIGRLWTDAELKVCANSCYPDIPWEDVVRRALFLGNVPRALFTTEMGFENFVADMLSAIATKSVDQILSSLEANTWELYSHRILLLDKHEDGTVYQKIPSAFVAQMVLSKTEANSWNRLCDVFNKLRPEKKYATSVGNMLEVVCHNGFPLQMSDTKLISEASSSEVPSEALTPPVPNDMHKEFFGDHAHFDFLFQEALHAGNKRQVYYRSYNQMVAAVDSFLVNFSKKQVRLYQMTINHRHGILTSPVRGWLAYFQSFGFTVLGIYFVTDGQAFPGFGQQKWKFFKDGDTSYIDAHNQRGPLCQFAVKFDYQFGNALSWSNATPPSTYVEEVSSLNSARPRKLELEFVPGFTGQDYAERKRKRGIPTLAQLDTLKLNLLCVTNEQAEMEE